MTQIALVAAVLVLRFAVAPQAVAGENRSPQRTAEAPKSQERPPGWSDLLTKTLDLTLAGKHVEVIAIYEKAVADYPNFAEARAMLGGAHESLARALAASRAPDAPATRTKHLELAVVHLRRAVELEGRHPSFMTMRSLIDLHGRVGLNRPADYERLVREGVTRHASEPLAHAYLIALVASKGEALEGSVGAARAAIPRGMEGRVDLAGALAQFAGEASPPAAASLLAAAVGLADEALTIDPAHTGALEQNYA